MAYVSAAGYVVSIPFRYAENAVIFKNWSVKDLSFNSF